MTRISRSAIVGALLALGAVMPRAADVPIRFTDVAAATGLVLPKLAVSPAKDFLIDTTGNGVAFFDYDRDGDIDVYVANYVRTEPGKIPSRATGTCHFMNIDVACGPRPLPGEPDRLYHNTGPSAGSGQARRFVDVTKRTGAIDPGHYGFSVLFS